MRYHSEGYQPLFRCCLWSMVLLLAAGCAHPMPVSDRSAEENEMSDRNPSTTCTLMVLRHCEKGPGSDPSLTSEGQERAKELANLLGEEPITRLLCTEYRRTHETLEPLAARVGVEIETIRAGNSSAWHQALGDIAAGDCVVICGHQNTVPLFVEAVGGFIDGTEQVSGQQWIPGHIFDRLYIVTWPSIEAIPAASALSKTRQYGVPCD
jgi:phosphohistidine phosphatase SixA